MPRAKPLYQPNVGALVIEATAFCDADAKELRNFCAKEGFLDAMRGNATLVQHMVQLEREAESRPATPREALATINAICEAASELLEQVESCNTLAGVLLDWQLARVGQSFSLAHLAAQLSAMNRAHDGAACKANAIAPLPTGGGGIAARLVRDTFRRFEVKFTTTAEGPAVVCTAIVLRHAGVVKDFDTVRGYVREVISRRAAPRCK